jgi:hypothetical protein
MNETSARTLGISAPMSTTNGAFLTPRFMSVVLLRRSRVTSASCTIPARSRDSSILLFSVMALTMSGRVCISPACDEFSRAATASASADPAKLRK